jgi:hypothetical protein
MTHIDRAETTRRLGTGPFPRTTTVRLEAGDTMAHPIHSGTITGPAQVTVTKAGPRGLGVRTVLTDPVGPDGLTTAERDALLYLVNDFLMAGEWAPLRPVLESVRVKLLRATCPA